MTSLYQDLRDLNGYDGKNSLNWFRNAAQLLRISGRNQTKRDILQNAEHKFVTSIELGKMYFYEYDAKHKDTLPYWDRFPLIFVLNRDSNGFLGLNMHYLRPDYRLAFFNKLQQFVSDPRLNKRAKLMVQYKLISDMTKFPETRDCVKRYLWTHVKSRWMEIPPKDWRNIVMLPLQSFEKRQAQSVWASNNKRYK